jgi:hypothetical protein
MWIFVFHTKNNGFSIVLNSQLHQLHQLHGAHQRRDVLTAKAHFINEILKMLTVEAYRKDI